MKKQMTKLLSVFLVVVMLFGSVSALVLNTDAYTYLAYGIDVSAWQGNINWQSVKDSGIDFAILRIMASGKDKYFETYYTNAKAVGMKLGIYCYSYADTVAEAQAEATKVLSWLGGRKLEYPIYYDIEDANQQVLTKAQRTQLCIAFCDVIEAAGYRAGIYSGTYWFNNYLDRATLSAKYEIWEAMWPASGGVQVGSPIYDKSSTCGLWQYTSRGSIPGISGNVDRNVSYKDYASYMIANGYNGYGNGSGEATPTPTPSNLSGYYQTTASVNFRAGPSTAYGIISTLPAGTVVAVSGFDSSTGWAMVSYGGSSGYISNNYVSYIRSFAYAMNYLTNNSTVMAAQTITKGSVLTVPNPPADPDGKTFVGWQFLRQSDFLWYTGSTWDSAQINSKIYQPGDKIEFSDAMFNPLAGDENFYLCAVWKDTSSPTTPPAAEVIPVVTPDTCAPYRYCWYWNTSNSYGFFGGYGKNGQDIEMSVDLALLSSDAVAVFYTDGTAKQMSISKDKVTVGTTSVSYDWGSTDISNWHDVKFKIYNGKGYVYIDGVQIASEEGMTANTQYQLLFSFPGEMAIDNVLIMDTQGTTYFTTDYESEDSTSKMLESLGERQLLIPDTTDFDVLITPASATITGTGSAKFTASPSAGEGHTYKWSFADTSYNKYLSADGNSCTVKISSELLESISLVLNCTVTSEGNVTSTSSATLHYVAVPTPTIYSVTPESQSIVGTGTVTYTVDAAGTDLSYMWTSSEPALDAYLSGVNTNTLTVNIPKELDVNLTSTITCTVTNTYGKSAEKAVSLAYQKAPVPTINSITPEIGEITNKGTVTYKANVTGEGLTYKWTCSDDALTPYISGADTSTLTIKIPAELADSISATVTLTVTNAYGKTDTATALFDYTVELDGGMEFYITGDLDGSNSINALDVNKLKRILSGALDVEESVRIAADINGDGVLNSLDANILSRMVAGKI